eukprot:TRINITY_DN289_c0_g1_i1.p1 TRINITY_DN289_c0_g1~~TRINITY_DN289_c0_g1_i1.p1  ORF type:complete len:1136 (+),score=444.09 TRINITY_DN289_c0_g1_i1:64-3471(+)
MAEIELKIQPSGLEEKQLIQPKAESSESEFDVKSFDGYRFNFKQEFLYWFLSVITGGTFALIAYWFPQRFVSWRYEKCGIDDADYVLVATQFDVELVPVEYRAEEANFEKERRYLGLLPAELPRGSIIPLRDRMLVFRYMRFVWNNHQYVPVPRFDQIRGTEVRAVLHQGLNAEEATDKRILYGPNIINVVVKPWLQILVSEVFQPFFVFQIYSVILWCFEQYYIFAGTIFVLAVSSVTATLIETRSMLQSVSAMARYECPVQVLRKGKYQEVSSSVLVPGDVIQVSSGMILPCDLTLLQGGAVVNEAMLTGESVPVVKSALDWEDRDAEQLFTLGSDQRQTLFASTSVLQTKPRQPDEPVVGLVVRTNFHTSKGALVLSILFPRPSFFKFVQQSYLFIVALFLISLIGMGISIWKLEGLGSALDLMVLRGLDLITIVVPPTLPLAMSVGTNWALVCLKKMEIFCISPNRINMAGKVKLFCFDKTGTLTSEGMEMLGVQPATNAKFAPLSDDLQQLPLMAVWTMASCHTLARVNDQLVGDPLEMQIFSFTGASMQENVDRECLCLVSSDKPKFSFRVRTQFEFQSELQRMSVIAENVATSEVFCFAKGSPEAISRLSLPHTIPPDFDKVLAHLTHQGYRVIAIASRRFANWQEVPEFRKDELRAFMESDLVFDGLVVLENKLKPETAPVLRHLHDARVRQVMVTGDNVLTAVTVAKESRLVPSLTQVILGRLVDGQLEWVDSDSGKVVLDSATLMPLPELKLSRYELAVTGDVFAYLYNQFQAENVPLSESYFHKVLVSAQVFARMTPSQKAALVSEYQTLGLYVGMCGDGANDCGALKAAHVGVSLSESEASIAAPFTYRKPNISCISVLLKEGRSSLVTSFQLFRYMAMYSMIQFTAVILCYFEGSVFGNWQYLYQDLWINFPLTILMGTSLAAQDLSVKRPSGHLLSVRNLCATIGHMLICFAFQLAIYYLTFDQDGFVDLMTPDNGPVTWHTTSLYYFSNFQYLIMVLLFALGFPWKRSPHTNHKFSVWYVISLVSCLLMLLTPKSNVFLFSDDIDLPSRWRGLILLLVGINMVASTIYELLIIPLVVRFFQPAASNTTVFGPGIKHIGRDVKPFHPLRQAFEAGWGCKLE